MTTYGLEHGLPTLSLEAMGEGPGGQLLLSLTNGIFTFDGRWFRALETVEPTPGEEGLEAIPSYTSELLRDRRGVVWGGCAKGGLWRMEGGLVCEVPTEGTLARTRILAEGADGTIWAGGSGLVRVDGSSAEVLIDAREFPDMQVTSLLEARSSSEAMGALDFEIATNEGLFRWSQAGGLQRVDSVPIVALFRDGSNRRWRLGEENISINGQEGVLRYVGEEGAMRYEGPATRLLSSVAIDAERTLIALDTQAYVADFHGGEPRLESYGDPYTISDVMPGPGDSVWVTTRNHGLRLLRSRYFERIEVPAPGRSMFVVQPSGPDEVLLGSWIVPRLWRWNSGSGKSSSSMELLCDWSEIKTSLPPMPGAFDALSVDGTSGFVQTRMGLVSFDDRSSEIVLSEGWAPLGRLVQVASGAIWVRAGERILEWVDGRETGRSFEIGAVHLTKMLADGENFLGFENGRIVTFDTESMTRTVELVLDEGLLGGLYLQSDGSLWVLTDGKGLYRRNTLGVWHHWTTEDGLPTNSLGWASVVPGPTESTHLWINSNEGVLAVSFASFEATAAGQQPFLECAVLGTPESLAGDGVACSDGKIVVPTFEGPIVVNTHRPLPRSTPPSLSLGEVLVDGHSLEGMSPPRGTADVVFEYQAAQFPFQYSSVVEYRLDGHDSHWVKGNDQRRARYTSLAPGRYQLQIRARAPGTGYGPVLRSPVLEILPYWYDRTSARILMAAGLLALGVGAFRLRTRILRRRSKVLEELLDRVSLSEDRYRRLFQSTPTSIVIWGKEGLALELNEAALQLFGCKQSARRTLPELAAGETGQQVLEEAVRRGLAGEEPEPVQLATLVAGGAVHSCCWYVVPLVREGGEVWALMTLVVDQEDEVQAAEAVKQLRRQLARAEEAERAKLARDLHDDFSQRLAAVSLDLRLAGDETEGRIDPAHRAVLEESIESIDGLARDVHRLSRQLHPAVLDDLGLVAALRSECARRARLSGAEITLEAPDGDHRLSIEARLALFRVAQESMLNAVKHSGATRILVRIAVESDRLTLLVQDDGSGFDPAKGQSSGIGLSSMRERMSLVEGAFFIESVTGKGTTIRASAPTSPSLSQCPAHVKA